MGLQENIVKYFRIEERGSTIANELHGALTTFLTMSYILLVNPQVVAKIGVPAKDVVIATALSGAVGSILCGIFGNLPFGMSPGIGLSAYLVYGLVLSQSMPLHRAFTSCFISGIILVILSITGATGGIMRLIPRSVKLAVVSGMGLQIALVGMTMVDMVVPNQQTIVGLGRLDNYKLWLCLGGLIGIGSMLFHEVPGAILLGIILLTVISWTIEDTWPTQYVMFPSPQMSVSDFINFDDIDWPSMGPAIVAFLFIGIVDVGAVVFGMASMANITESNGSVPGSLFAFLGCAVGSMVGASLGSTPVIVYVETAAGIKSGSRTGLTACTIGAMFLLSLFLAPVFSEVPNTATAPVSILVGAMMMSQSAFIDWNNMTEAIPAFLTMVIMPFTFSITNGILFGLISAICFSITSGNAKRDIRYCLGYEDDEELSQTKTLEMSDSVTETTKLTGQNSTSADGIKRSGSKRTPPSSPHHQHHLEYLPGPGGTSPNLRVHGKDDVVRVPSLVVSERDALRVAAAHGGPVKDYMSSQSNNSGYPREV